MTTDAPAPAADGGVLGLTTPEVLARRAAGQSNDVADPTSRSVADIVRANVLTPFNLLLGSLLVVILAVREYRDALFGIVLVLNALIGIVQEVRSKRTLDRLALLNAPRATVVRDGAPVEVPTRELVLDDVIVLGPGDQITVDGTVLDTSGLEVDESLLTGEAEPVDKHPGDGVLSGSFVVAGSGRIRATAVGTDAYARQLAAEARRFSLVRSELRDGINRIIRVVGWLMLPTAVLLVTAQLAAEDDDLVDAVQGAVAGLVAMVPEGLVLLTSIAFAVGATRLARRKVLTQELAAIEGLARVDVICLDKTGTLTEGALVLATVEHLDGGRCDTAAVLAAMAAADEHPNPSLLAVRARYPDDPGWSRVDTVPFSSARKWAAAAFDGHGAWYLGAPDILLWRVASPGHASDRLRHHAERGRRVLLLALAPDGCLRGEELPGALEPVALVVLEEKVRDSAPDTIRYFGDQEVTVKIISGDNPVTVSAVARRVGVPDAERALDARALPEESEAMAEALENHAVFGRVTPQQKRAMVHALQRHGHTVAMTGDGVNDTLALKDADIGVAMGSGSQAARAVARFVLLDNDFAVFPSVVAEGRRVIANVERVANLFLTKTFYAVTLALAVGVGRLPFPFIPRHLTVISSLTIGIPGFFLALAPNARRARPGFLSRVLRFAVPAGLIAASATLVSYQVVRLRREVPLDEARTVAVITLFLVALWVLAILARPFNAVRAALVGSMAGAFVVILAVPALRAYFELPLPDPTGILTAAGVGAGACGILEIGWRLSGWIDGRRSGVRHPPPGSDHRRRGDGAGPPVP